jgi:hypothetical protein
MDKNRNLVEKLFRVLKRNMNRGIDDHRDDLCINEWKFNQIKKKYLKLANEK